MSKIGSNPVAKRGRSPESPKCEGVTSLTGLVAQDIVKQWIEQNPSQLGQVIASLEKKKKRQAFASAIKAAHASDVTEYAESDYSLRNDDTVHILNHSSSFDDIEFGIVKVRSLPETVAEILKIAYHEWAMRQQKGKLRTDCESNGCFKIEIAGVDCIQDAFEDAIEERIEDLEQQHEDDEQEDEEDGFDADSCRDSIVEELGSFFSDAEWQAGHETLGLCSKVYQKVPKIAICFDTES